MELELFFDPQDPKCPMLREIADVPIRLHTEEMEAAEETTPLETTIGEALEQGHILTEWAAYFMGVSRRFVDHLGIPAERQRFRAHLHEERSHYSSQTYDHEVQLDSIGWLEIAGHAYRTDYDLKAHQKGSGQDMTALRDGTRFTPHVVEPSFGLDRLFLAALEISYERRDKRNIFTLPRDIAPYQVSVFPLVTKDGLPERAGQVHGTLQGTGLATFYDEGGSVGRRYARSDEAGTPLAVTIDYTTLEDDTVTVRDRDSWGQVRTATQDLTEKLKAYFTYGIDFGDLGDPV
jgi:glycyl-tRNA synthetase